MKKPTITARCSTHAQGDHVRAVLSSPALPNHATRTLRREREAHITAAAYRLAAEITILNVDLMCAIAIDVHWHDGVVTLELAKDQRIELVERLLQDALAKLRISATWLTPAPAAGNWVDAGIALAEGKKPRA